MEHDQKNKDLASIPIHNLKDYMGAFYILVIENLNRDQLVTEDWDRTIAVSSLAIGPKIKRLNRQQKTALINSGRKSALIFLSRN